MYKRHHQPLLVLCICSWHLYWLYGKCYKLITITFWQNKYCIFSLGIILKMTYLIQNPKIGKLFLTNSQNLNKSRILCFYSSMECWIFLQGAWAGILHHVVNEHECLMSYDNDMTHTKCQHAPLPEERNTNYLEKVSDALMALTNNVMDKRLLNIIPIYLNCRYDSLVCDFISGVHQVSFANSFGEFQN